MAPAAAIPIQNLFSLLYFFFFIFHRFLTSSMFRFEQDIYLSVIVHKVLVPLRVI